MFVVVEKKIKQAPDTSGVYLFKDAGGKVIYIGKAKSLKKRLASYVGSGLSGKTLSMMAQVADIEWQLAPTEAMALLLEASLIHKYHPRYNISLRDDKSFPLVKFTNEPFPCIFITRKREDDKARYFGPYTSAGLLREALKIIRHAFPFRSCRKMPRLPCIYYRLGLSPAPCAKKITEREYARTIANISLLLEGRTEALIKKMVAQMQQKAKRREYEGAAVIRDQISVLSSLGSAQANPSGLGEMEGLQKLLGLRHLPVRIEAFDISNISGQEATGSMVSFYKGLADKNNYRRFRIRGVEGIDDYKMTAEVVQRRYSRLVEERLPLPDLILIDGGKGHLLTAQNEIRKLGLRVPLASIAKQEENIYIQGRQEPIRLSCETPALNLVRRIRDEAHRFARSYHHLLRKKKIIGK